MPWKMIKNFLFAYISFYYFKSVQLVIVMSVCGFYKYLTNEKHSKELVTTFTFMHLADAFIQSDLHCIQVTGFFYILSARAFPGNRTMILGVASAMLYHLSYRKVLKTNLVMHWVLKLSVKPHISTPPPFRISSVTHSLKTDVYFFTMQG